MPYFNYDDLGFIKMLQSKPWLSMTIHGYHNFAWADYDGYYLDDDDDEEEEEEEDCICDVVSMEHICLNHKEIMCDDVRSSSQKEKRQCNALHTTIHDAQYNMHICTWICLVDLHHIWHISDPCHAGTIFQVAPNWDLKLIWHLTWIRGRGDPTVDGPGMYKTLSMMGLTANVDWLAGFLPSTVWFRKNTIFRC